MCRGFGLCKHSPDRVDLKEPRCWAWSCEECAPIRQRVLVAQLHCGEPTKFLTLTCRWTDGQDPIETCTRLMAAWNKLLKRLRRFHDGHEVEAFWVLEATKRGAPHLHIALRMPFTHWQIIRAMWVELTGWHSTDIRTMRDFKERVYYLTKYMGKEPHKFGTHKRYGRTKRYLQNWEGKHETLLVFGEPRWERVKGKMIDYRHSLIYQGCFIEVIDNWNSRAWRLGYWPERVRGPPCAGLGCFDPIMREAA